MTADVARKTTERTMIFDEAPKERFEMCEAEGRALLTALEAGEAIDLIEDSLMLGTVLEYLLCDLFENRKATRGYWCDGFLIDQVELIADRTIRLRGRAWCADHRNEWKALPAQADLGFSTQKPPCMEQIRISVGNADAGTLMDHTSRHELYVPERWLHKFHVPRPPDDTKPGPATLIERLNEWASRNPTRPILGSDWQPLTAEQAAAYIQAEASEGRCVELEETWLDGGIALRLG